MYYIFHAFGHKNVLGAHRTTFEFTKDEELSLRGDCIVGVRADFDLGRIKDFIKSSKGKKITIKISAIKNNERIEEIISAELNLHFKSNNEIIIRKTAFSSERTFAINADKSSIELNRTLIDFLKEGRNKVTITVENKD